MKNNLFYLWIKKNRENKQEASFWCDLNLNLNVYLKKKSKSKNIKNKNALTEVWPKADETSNFSQSSVKFLTLVLFHFWLELVNKFSIYETVFNLTNKVNYDPP